MTSDDTGMGRVKIDWLSAAGNELYKQGRYQLARAVREAGANAAALIEQRDRLVEALRTSHNLLRRAVTSPTVVRELGEFWRDDVSLALGRSPLTAIAQGNTK